MTRLVFEIPRTPEKTDRIVEEAMLCVMRGERVTITCGDRDSAEQIFKRVKKLAPQWSDKIKVFP